MVPTPGNLDGLTPAELKALLLEMLARVRDLKRQVAARDRTAPGLPEAGGFEADRNLLLAGMVLRLGLGWRDIADWLEETVLVEPVHPFEGAYCGFRSMSATASDLKSAGDSGMKSAIPI